MITKKTKKNVSWLLATAVSASYVAACGPSASTDNAGRAGADGNDNTPFTEAVIASGWDEVAMVSHGADIKVSPSGHFMTSRNSCFHVPDSGATDVDMWNPFATAMNTVVAQDPLQEERCFPMPPTDWNLGGGGFWWGSFEVKMPSGKRPLFERRGEDMCTRVADANLAEQLLKSVEPIIKAAQTEGCPANP